MLTGHSDEQTAGRCEGLAELGGGAGEQGGEPHLCQDHIQTKIKKGRQGDKQGSAGYTREEKNTEKQ